MSGIILLYEQKAQITDEIWDELLKLGMKGQKLTVFLWYLMERGLRTNSSVTVFFPHSYFYFIVV